MTTAHDGRRPVRRDLHGILLLDKPLGVSSNRALQRARRALGARKAGHTGSLDPLATGMLPLCFGDATRVSQLLLDADKTYTAVAALGSRTDTGDAEGSEVETATVPDLDVAGWQLLADGFLGEGEQVPPMYSALKQDGRRLYELARRGEAVERKPRRIRIAAFEVTALEGARLSLRVQCSKGTYIRTLVEDLARAAGTVAHTAALRREAVAPFEPPMLDLETVEALEPGAPVPEGWLLPVDAALAGWPAVTLDTGHARRFCEGQRLAGMGEAALEAVRVLGPGGEFLGTAAVDEAGVLRPSRVMAGACAAFSAENSG